MRSAPTIIVVSADIRHVCQICSLFVLYCYEKPLKVTKKRLSQIVLNDFIARNFEVCKKLR